MLYLLLWRWICRTVSLQIITWVHANYFRISACNRDTRTGIGDNLSDRPFCDFRGSQSVDQSFWTVVKILRYLDLGAHFSKKKKSVQSWPENVKAKIFEICGTKTHVATELAAPAAIMHARFFSHFYTLQTQNAVHPSCLLFSTWFLIGRGFKKEVNWTEHFSILERPNPLIGKSCALQKRQ